MTDEVIDSGSSQGQPQASSEVAPASTPTHAENMIAQSKVDAIVHERTRAALDKGYQKGREEAAKAQPASSFGGVQQMSEDQQRQMMREEFERLHNDRVSDYKKQQTQQQINDLANNYLGKIEAAKEQYPDLVSRREEIGEFAELIPFINETDNAAGITQHLLDNGHNVASLLVLADKSPAYARRELKRLSDSIKQNETAKSWPHINPPLGQVQPSINTMDSSSSSIEALKNTEFLRG